MESRACKHGSGNVWLMESGAWDIRVEVSGSQGTGKMAVPVAAYASRTLPMQKALAVLLFGLMLFLAIGIVSIAGAAAREAVLSPGISASSKNRRSGRIANGKLSCQEMRRTGAKGTQDRSI